VTHRSCSEARPQERQPVTLADIVRAHTHELGAVTPQQGHVLSAIAACRTPSLGGHRFRCDSCGHSLTSYNSCRNRHCPQCQALSQARWVEKRQADLLPVEYFHVVFTIPSELHDIFLAHPAAAYNQLFATAAESLTTLTTDPRHLGAQIGAMGVLHTWTQILGYHPHVHFIVAGGGPSPDGARWVSCRRGFFLPVRALSLLFRGKLLAALESGLKNGQITSPRNGNALRLLKRAARKKWTVYAKPSFVGPEHVLRYLGRYTHRIAISNRRLVSFADGKVTFLYQDRAAGDKTRTRTLPAVQFLRCFLLHTLPPGFVRIRYFGGLSHAKRKSWLAISRQLLAEAGVQLPADAADDAAAENWQELLLRLTGFDVTRCPACSTGRLVLVETLAPHRSDRGVRPREGPT
jgi:hypothetical protein